MPDNTFRLFPEDKEASPGDALIQFLIDEQQKGNKRAKTIGKFLSKQMGEVFPGFSRALGDVTSGAEKRKQQLNEIFGLGANLSVGEAALGFGVGSIGKVPPKVFGGRSSKKLLKRQKPSAKIEGQEVFKEPNLLERQELIRREQSVKTTGQENLPFEPFGSDALAFEFQRGLATGATRNVGGQRPSTATLEAKAAIAQTTKRTQSAVQIRLNKLQKDLDRQLLKEVDPNNLPDDSLVKTKNKGIKKITAVVSEETGSFGIEFRSSLKKTENPEFVLGETSDGLRLVVDFNSKLIKPQLQGIFRRNFNNRFVGDIVEPTTSPGIKQRLKTGISEGAILPDNLSIYTANSFDDALQLINSMLDRAKQIKSK